MKDCSNCRWYLGAGQCHLNVESECAEGGGYELWDNKKSNILDTTTSTSYDINDELKEFKIALAKMWFAYINKDEDYPADYEIDAISTARRLLGDWTDAMKLLNY